jgi:glutathione S-transferase
MLKIWGRRNSFNVQKVMWLVGELGLEHQHIDAGGSFGGLDRPEFLQMNPHGRVPVVDDDGVTVWESHSIIRYLSAKYGRGSLWIDEPAQRSFADRWMDWSLATLQPDFMDLFWGFYRTPAEKRDWPRINARVARCAEHFRLLDRHLAGKSSLAGSRLTMADIPAGTALYRYFELDVEHPVVPNVTAWYERLQLRAPYQQHVMIPFDDLRGRLQY